MNYNIHNQNSLKFDRCFACAWDRQVDLNCTHWRSLHGGLTSKTSFVKGSPLKEQKMKGSCNRLYLNKGIDDRRLGIVIFGDRDLIGITIHSDRDSSDLFFQKFSVPIMITLNNPQRDQQTGAASALNPFTPAFAIWQPKSAFFKMTLKSKPSIIYIQTFFEHVPHILE